MPIFGEFETVGEPLQAVDERGHASTVWQARKTSSGDNRLFVVKVYAARRGAARSGEGEEKLDADRNLEFLEGVKQWRKVQVTNGRGLAPVHDLGLTDQGAWYATDFYPRGSLKAWISRRGGVDPLALRQILHSIVTACLSLKGHRGCSHGNIKPANVFLVGKARPLRKTPFVLSDPYPAAPLQLAQLDAGDQRVTGDLLRQIMEAQDLRAMGELLLQLVEGRLVRTAYDYNYPVADSESWQKLGKHGEEWRQLCNRLLDPQLAIETTSLEILERELRPNALAAKMPLVLAGIGVVGIVAAGVILGMKHTGARREARFAGLTNAAAASFGQREYERAWSNATAALKIRANDPEMLRIQSWSDATNKALALARQEQGYREWTNTVGRALIRSDFDGAISNADLALKAHPQDPVLLALRSRAAAEKKQQETQQAEDRSYRSITNLVTQLLARNNHDLAISNLDFALRTRAQDAVLAGLRAKAVAEKSAWEAQNAQQRAYRSLTNLVTQLLGQNDYDRALSNIDFGLRTRAEDVPLLTLRRKAQAEKQEWDNQQAQERSYRSLTNLVGQLLAANEHEAALSNIDFGLGTRQGDRTLTAFRTKATAAKAEWDRQQAEARNYQTLTNLVVQLLLRNEYNAAISNLDFGLSLRRQDPALSSLRQRAVADKKNWDTQQAAERSYQGLTNLIGQLVDRREYAAADSNISFGLGQRQGDRVLLALRARSAQEKKGWDAQQEEERSYRSLTNLVGQLTARYEFDGAMSNADFGLRTRKDDRPLLALRAKAAADKKNWDAQQAAERDYRALTNRVGQLLAQEQYDAALSNIDLGLRSRREDPTLTALRTKAVADRQRWENQQAQERSYRSLTNLVGQLLAAGAFDAAISNADFGLKSRGQDPFLLAARSKANDGKALAAAAQQERLRFQSETNRIGELIAKGDFDSALSAIAAEDRGRAGDAMLRALRARAEKGKQERELAAQQFTSFQASTNQAWAALGSGDHNRAQSLINAALKIYPNNAGAQEIERRIKAEMARAQTAENKRRMDESLASARRAFEAGQYAEALQLCSAYSGETDFADLLRKINEERTAYTSARNSFDGGDYGFLATLKNQSFATKGVFKELIASAEAEQTLFNQLDDLRKKSDWAQLAARFREPQVAAINKTSFTRLRDEAARNDPARLLETRFHILQIFFGIRGPETINGRQYGKLPPGTGVEYYRNQLRQLLQEYSRLKVAPPPEAEVGALQRAMNNF